MDKITEFLNLLHSKELEDEFLALDIRDKIKFMETISETATQFFLKTDENEIYEQ